MIKSIIQRSIKIVNIVFIKIILFIFYIIIIGLGALIYRIFKNKQNRANSYWQDYSQKELGFNDFKSAY